VLLQVDSPNIFASFAHSLLSVPFFLLLFFLRNMRVIASLLAIIALSISVSAQAPTGVNNTFHITNGNGVDYTFSENGATFNDPALSLVAGQDYFFSIDFLSGGHPFGISATAPGAAVVEAQGLTAVNAGNCGTASSGNAFTTTNTATPCVLKWTAPAVGSAQLYYHCSIHPAMSGALNIVAGGAASSSSGSSSSGSSSSGSSLSSSSSTGVRNAAGRATVIPGLAMVAAAIVALVA